MVWTAMGVAGIACVVAAVALLAGPAWALLVAGLALVLAAIDGRRP